MMLTGCGKIPWLGWFCHVEGLHCVFIASSDFRGEMIEGELRLRDSIVSQNNSDLL